MNSGRKRIPRLWGFAGFFGFWRLDFIRHQNVVQRVRPKRTLSLSFEPKSSACQPKSSACRLSRSEVQLCPPCARSRGSVTKVPNQWSRFKIIILEMNFDLNKSDKSSLVISVPLFISTLRRAPPKRTLCHLRNLRLSAIGRRSVPRVFRRKRIAMCENR